MNCLVSEEYPVSRHLLKPRWLHSGGYRPSTSFISSRILPVTFIKFGAIDSFEREWSERVVFGTSAFKHKHHQPDTLRIVSLPSSIITRCFYFNSIMRMLSRVIFVFSLLYQIWMTIVVFVLHKGVAVLRNSGIHILADDTAEVCWHEHGFKNWHILGVEFSVNEAKKDAKVLHCIEYVFNLQSIGKFCFLVELFCCWCDDLHFLIVDCRVAKSSRFVEVRVSESGYQVVKVLIRK